jgi:predicted DNA-binding transcriptional regulator YafY
MRLLERGERDYTLADLAEAVGVCTRTVRRDIGALEEAGASVWREAPDEGTALRYTGLSWSEL